MASAQARVARSTARQAREVRGEQCYSQAFGSASNVAARTAQPVRYGVGTMRTAARPALRSTARPGVRSDTQAQARPQLRVSSYTERREETGIISHVWAWANARKAPYMYLVTSILVLLLSTFGTLVLRTHMVENAYGISQVQAHVSQLRQDVQQEQTKLDKLEANLPQKASELGMQQGTQSMTIDLGAAN